MKSLFLIFVGLLFNLNYTLSQIVNLESMLTNDTLLFNVSIENNTNDEVLIPLAYWGFSKSSLHGNDYTYLHNIISNIDSVWLNVFEIADSDIQWNYKFLPKFLSIKPNQKAKISMILDTNAFLNIFHEKQIEDYFRIRLAIADAKVLRELFSILEKDLDKYIIQSEKININFKDKLSYLEYLGNFSTNIKLNGNTKQLIKLPFLNNYIFTCKLKR